MDEPLFIALILNSLDIDAENFRDNIDKIQKVASSNATLTKKDLIDISSLMFYIEETRDISQETRNMLREATLNWLNAYIDGTAEDVTIEERSFTEASPVSSIWQAANDKYGSQQAQVTNS